MAFQHLSDDTRASYGQAKEALKARFEPPSRKDLYKAEFQSRRKKRAESWADFAEDLKILIDKAYPHLEAAARDQMALTHYLSQIDNPQIAFSVKQQKPATLDAAVSATLEMWSPIPRHRLLYELYTMTPLRQLWPSSLTEWTS